MLKLVKNEPLRVAGRKLGDMSRNTIRWIIALMSVALIGLVSFQWYWIDAMIEVNQERFRRDVQQALNTVAEKLERQEALLVTFDNFNSNIKLRSGTMLAPGNVAYIESTYKKWVVNAKKGGKERDQPFAFPSGFQYQFESGTGSNIFIIQDSLKMGVPPSAGEPWTFSSAYAFSGEKNDSIHMLVENGRSSIEKATQKQEMIQLALHELLFEKRTIAKRINQEQLDSLLQAELLNKGIDTEYTYAVIDETNGKLVMVSEGARKNIPHTEFKATLFPNDLIGDNSALVVNFPNQKSFLLQKIWTSMASSAVLVTTIIFCFGYAIQTIIRQKKNSEVKNDFINNMTHEFKTPISTVALACEALQDTAVSVNPDFQKRYLKIISDENKRLGQQVEKVLQMAALDKKDFKLKLEEVNVHDIIEVAAENIALTVRKRNGSLKAHLQAEQPVLLADHIHLTNIIYNLLDNANKYSPESPEIVIETRNVKGGITVAVNDKGIGMTKDSMSKIFDRFYRVPTGNVHDVKGFGLGLAYVKTMIEAHGGTISVKSEFKRGSTFEIYLPYGNPYGNQV